jgi:hypothetical protein
VHCFLLHLNDVALLTTLLLTTLGRMPDDRVKITNSTDVGVVVRSCYPLLRRSMDQVKTAELVRHCC